MDRERRHRRRNRRLPLGEHMPKLLTPIHPREIIRDDVRTPLHLSVSAATYRNVQDAAASGKFREALYFRLAVVVGTLPPLRSGATTSSWWRRLSSTIMVSSTPSPVSPSRPMRYAPWVFTAGREPCA